MKRKKKILFIITYLELGGAQKQLLSLIKGLDRDKYSLYLCAGDSGYLKKEFLSFSALEVKLIRELAREVNPFYDLIVFIKLYFYIRRNKFDIVHTHSPKASILGRWAAHFAGVKNIVYTVHGWPFHRFMKPLLQGLYIFLEKITAGITKKIIIVSSADLRKGIEKKVAFAGKFVIIHYGVDISWANSIFLKRKSNFSFDNSIVNISCLKSQKGLIYFLEAVKAILNKRADIKFSIVGDGPLREDISKEINKRELTKYVSLGGWMGDMSTLFSRASILVITSLWEGLPLAVIEAVMSGVPVVATDTGGISDILDNYNRGIIVKCKDVKAIAIAVLTILEDYGRWHKLIIAAREKLNLRYWSNEAMVRRTEKVYQEVLVV